MDAGQHLTGLTLEVDGVEDGSREWLTFNDGNVPLVAGTTTSYSSAGGGTAEVTGSDPVVVTVSGVSWDDTRATEVLAGMTYRDNGDDPTAGTRTVRITGLTDDGSENTTVSPDVEAPVTVAPVNDPPT
jgi:hypothetical protein